eukprot:TRINITY_DN17070_c0_g1_i1.p1 TRINITY_DN17070_c0_g1~~TRINITY_DN17070_c0_g1_i1.p1  ORF type:complete len:272 (-),score=38.42 TRINITY_DN17070_c0_g1_i1:75-890(-)
MKQKRRNKAKDGDSTPISHVTLPAGVISRPVFVVAVRLVPSQSTPPTTLRSPVFDISINGMQSPSPFSQQVRIQFNADHVTGNREDLCLGYIDETLNSWVCEDYNLAADAQGNIAGSTWHFTTFALILAKPGPTTPRDVRHADSGLIPALNHQFTIVTVVGVTVIVVVVTAITIAVLVRRQRRRSARAKRARAQTIAERPAHLPGEGDVIQQAETSSSYSQDDRDIKIETPLSHSMSLVKEKSLATLKRIASLPTVKSPDPTPTEETHALV